jgi:RND family efflux transporter MFP subunit
MISPQLPPILQLLALGLVTCGTVSTISCGPKAESAQKPQKSAPASTTVSVVPVEVQRLQTNLTVSSELVPFQEIDVYAKESGYIKRLLVDYGTHVRQGQLMAVLEIPELEAQLEQDQGEIKAASDQVTQAQNDLHGIEAQAKVAHLIYARLNGVAQSKPGLVAQQEVDDAQGKDLWSQAQLQAAKSNLENAQSHFTIAQAKLKHDQALFEYSRITAPFDGIVTQRYANLGALMQAGTTSTQAMPLVRLSEENLFRLSIPVPESDVRYIRIGDPVQVRVPSLAKTFDGHVARISVQVAEDTRTMYTEVDVENRNHELMPGLYAEAIISLQRKNGSLAVPLQAVDRQGARTMVDVLDSNNKIETRDITLGIETSDHAEVLTGLQQGERVIVSDRSLLKPGEQVTAKPAEKMSYTDNNSDRQ